MDPCTGTDLHFWPQTHALTPGRKHIHCRTKDMGLLCLLVLTTAMW